jgi:hypothetical protein
MLPQGYSAVLKARPSQQVDVDWGNSVHQLLDIMNNTVACKLFAGKSILCVGADMLCHPKGKRVSLFLLSAVHFIQLSHFIESGYR